MADWSAFPVLSAFDPRGGLGGSIDPLGTLATYAALANLILPGVTTVTTHSRYLSMLCAALTTADEHKTFPPGPAGQIARRQAIEPYERLWALACVAARENGRRNAASGLRGVTFAERKLREFRDRDTPAMVDFRMLKSQTRTGGAAAYWTTLLSADLVGEDGRPTAAGRELARTFPGPSSVDLAALVDPHRSHRVSMALRRLDEWSNACHLAGAERTERRQLLDALRASDRRDRIARALEAYAAEVPLPDTWGVPELRRLQKLLEKDEVAVRLSLSEAVDGTVVMEQFHEASLAIFESVLWWGTLMPDRPIVDLVRDAAFRATADAARARGQVLSKLSAVCSVPAVSKAIQELAVFADGIARLGEPRDVLMAVLNRHHQVQSGKVHGGAPKRDWITWMDGRVVRSSPRYQRSDRPSSPKGRMLTHPYRLEQFVGMLRENGGLPRVRDSADG